MGGVGVAGELNEAVQVLPAPLDDPIVVAGIVGVAILSGFGYVIARFLRRTPGQKFARVLDDFDSIAVLMHPNPDPDAMACALAAKEIAEVRGAGATMYYPGQIRHHENRAFETVLDVEFERIENAYEIDEEAVVLVDHNEPRGIPNAESIDPIAVVDHHPGGGSGEKFTDVRTENGACATIFSEYFRDLGWKPVSPSADESEDGEKQVLRPDVTTGLVFGIQADTNQLTNGCSEAEFEAAQYLFRGIDEDKLDRIANPDMDAESLDIKARAITNRDVRAAFAVSDVGTVSNADAIPQAADELRRLEGIGAVVVMGEKDGIIRLSGRSSDDRVHMGKVLNSVVEDVPMSGAGGHARMGGGTVSLEHMEGLGPSEGLSREDLKERLFDAMSGDL